jgi:hypothetical protein
MEAFHGSYSGSKASGLCGLRPTRPRSALREGIWAGGFTPIAPGRSWKHLARYLQTHAAQGYLAWHDLCHRPIGNCGQRLDAVDVTVFEEGINVPQVTSDEQRRCQWVGAGDPDAKAEAVRNLVGTPWDWLLEDEGRRRYFGCWKRNQAGSRQAGPGPPGCIHAWKRGGRAPNAGQEKMRASAFSCGLNNLLTIEA